MCEKPFFVDPMSYLFGQPYEDFKQRVRQGGSKFKPSFDRLMLGHGLAPEDFLPYDYRTLLRFLSDSPRNLEIFVDNAIAFQRERVGTTLRNARDLMTDEQKDSLDEPRFRPVFVIPPYFLYSPRGQRGDITAELNSRVLDLCSQNLDDSMDVFPMVFLRREHLGPEYRDDIIALYTRNAFPGYCIWIDGFDERESTPDDVRGLIELTRALAADQRQVVMLYGGFFSMLLYYFGLTAVCHGLAYGESRAIGASAQQGSGPAPVRYYVLELHRFLTLEDALTVLRQRPDLLCNCPACRRIVRGDPERVIGYQDEEAMAEIHFLYNRNQERRLIAESPLDSVVENLEWTLELNEDISGITKQYGGKARPIVRPDCIRAWKDVLSEPVFR
jgi:hypothetical protein